MRAHRVSLLLALSVVAACLPDPPVAGPREGTLPAIGPGASSDPSFGGDGGARSASAALSAPPEFGPTVQLDDPPPSLSGGTLAVTAAVAVAADPDRDLVYVVDRTTQLVTTVTLQTHDEPGRVVIDASGHAYVALRAGGAVVEIDLASGAIMRRASLCSAPRGLAIDPATKDLVVACATGDLVTIDTVTNAEKSRLFIAADLRDVAFGSGALWVSTFRDAQIYRIATGGGAAVPVLQEIIGGGASSFGRSRVAWRMVIAGEQPVVAQQRAPSQDNSDGKSAYNSAASGDDGSTPCMTNGPVPVIRNGNTAVAVPDAVLPIDIATNGGTVAVVAAGNAHTASLPQVVLLPLNQALGPDGVSCTQTSSPVRVSNAQITSVAYAPTGELLAFSRQPAALLTIAGGSPAETGRIALSAITREDTGHAIFHANSGAGLACASCHPEGREDGQIWSQPTGQHRTPSLLGTVKGTAPYHWMGEALNIGQVMQLTFESRMRGPTVGSDRVAAIDHFLGELRAMPAASSPDGAAVARGQAVYTGTGCATCHTGAMKTNNQSVDITTGGTFQVPSLVGVGWRAPYLHDGTASSLEALLQGPHAGAKLSSTQISDLTAYLQTF